ncbi:MAG: hypothetical protein IJK67_03155 [Bacilli bacterium]|nr:hypothetical protein [Bacilli bacterium]
MNKIKDVVKKHALFLFVVSNIIVAIVFGVIIIKYKLILFHILSISIVIYYIFKVIYYKIFGVLDD